MRVNIVQSQRSGAVLTNLVCNEIIVVVVIGCIACGYYMETTVPKADDNDQNQLKKWLMARTVGLPTAWNRLLNFHAVRSTKAVAYTPHMFVQDAASGFVSQRTAEHLIQQPEYPDPVCYLSFLGKYFYRNRALRHLRVEQFRALTGIHKG